MFGTRIKVDKDLYDRLKTASAKRGYASVEELIRDVLEKAAAPEDQDTDEELARKQLQGLGYLE